MKGDHSKTPGGAENRRDGTHSKITPRLEAPEVSSSCLLVSQYPVDRRSTYLQSFGDLRRSHALSLQSQHPASLRPRGWLAALVLALCLGFGDPLALTLQHQAPLELPDGADHREEQLAGGCGGIQVEVQDLEVGSLGLECLDDLEEVSGGSSQTVQLGDDQGVFLADERRADSGDIRTGRRCLPRLIRRSALRV